jgi:ubiquitin carboxyl-terminal hydrolase L5
MKGLAICNSPLIREAHNSLARPADIRASFYAASKHCTKAIKSKTNSRRKPGTRAERKTPQKQREFQETYHFIGYVPAHGKVWELDGLKSGPLEVGEIPPTTQFTLTQEWMSIVRPALRMKMRKYGRDNIRFSLLALVDDKYQLASDCLEKCKRERDALLRRLEVDFHGDTWISQVCIAAPTFPTDSLLCVQHSCLRSPPPTPSTCSLLQCTLTRLCMAVLFPGTLDRN